MQNLDSAPCAAACAPFKSSPATYATCCKQHAANAPKPKPVAAKPGVLKSRFPKPVSVTELHQGQVQRVDANLDTQRTHPAFKQLSDLVGGDEPQCPGGGVAGIDGKCPPVTKTAPTTTKSSGGGDSGKTFKEVRCQTGCGACKPTYGCKPKHTPRLQYGVNNGSTNVDFTVTVKIPENYIAKETATLQVGGAAHHRM